MISEDRRKFQGFDPVRTIHEKHLGLCFDGPFNANLWQALRCVENKLYRASHILAWTALIDLVENILASDGFKKLKAMRPKWNLSSLDELREDVSEFQIIEACKDLKLVNKGEMRIFHGLLGKRNLCAHPSDFFPDFNQTLGYVADVLSMMRSIQKKAVSE